MPARARAWAISFRRSTRAGMRGLLPSRSVGPLPATSTTPGTFWISLIIGSASVPARVTPPLPAKRTGLSLVPRGKYCACAVVAASIAAPITSVRRPIMCWRSCPCSCSGVGFRQLGHVMRHRLAAEDMDVEVEYRLAAHRAVVGDQAIAWRIESQLMSHLSDRAPETRDQLGRCRRREIGIGYVLAFGHDQDVDGRQRTNVMEGERELVLVDFPARQLAAQDAGEDVVAVVTRHA